MAIKEEKLRDMTDAILKKINGQTYEITHSCLRSEQKRRLDGSFAEFGGKTFGQEY